MEDVRKELFYKNVKPKGCLIGLTERKEKVMSKKGFMLDKEYINAIKEYGKEYSFTLEARLVEGGTDYIDCATANKVIKELRDFVNDSDFNAEDYECLAVLIYDSEERVDEYYFI